MANTVEFILYLKDLMSRKMQHAAAISRKSMADTAQSVKGVGAAAAATANIVATKMRSAATRGPKMLQYSINELQDRLNDLNHIRFDMKITSEFREADREAKKLESQIRRLKMGITSRGIGGRLKGWRQDFAAQLPGGQLLQNPLMLAGGVLTGIGKIVKEGMSSEQDIAGLQTFVGNKVKGVYFQMMKDAAKTPFSIDSFKIGSQALLSTGLSAKRTRTDMMNLANAVAAVGGNNEVFERMAVNMQQIKTQGKAMGIDLRQFAMGGINVYGILAKSLHKTVPEVKNMTITYDMLSNALASAADEGGAYFHGLYNQTHTLAGRIKIMRTEFMIMIKKIGLALKPYLDPIIDIAEKIVHGIITVFTKFKGIAAPAVLIIGGLAAAILVAAAAQWAFNAAQLGNPVTWIIVGIVALIALIAYLAYKIDGWGKAWKNLVKICKGEMNLFVDGVKLAWLYIEDYFMSGINKIQTAWYTLEKLWNKDTANAGLASIANEGAERAKKIAEQKNLLKADAYKVAKSTYDLLYNSFSWKKGVTFKSVKDKIKDKLGMDGGTGSGAPGQGSGSASNISSGVTSGGPRTITINVNKEMIGKLAINSYNVKEGVGEMENLIEEGLRRILYSAAAS